MIPYRTTCIEVSTKKILAIPTIKYQVVSVYIRDHICWSSRQDWGLLSIDLVDHHLLEYIERCILGNWQLLFYYCVL
jgi:hypothetical protein